MKCGIENAGRGLAVNVNEAIAVRDMLELVDVLQLNLKATVNEDADWYNRFLPLSRLVFTSNFVSIVRLICIVMLPSLICLIYVCEFQIMELVPNRSLVSTIQKVIDEDGSVKDSAVCLFLSVVCSFSRISVCV